MGWTRGMGCSPWITMRGGMSRVARSGVVRSVSRSRVGRRGSGVRRPACMLVPGVCTCVGLGCTGMARGFGMGADRSVGAVTTGVRGTGTMILLWLVIVRAWTVRIGGIRTGLGCAGVGLVSVFTLRMSAKGVAI